MVEKNKLAGSELLEYKYLAREKQVAAICGKLVETLGDEVRSKEDEYGNSVQAIFVLGILPYFHTKKRKEYLDQTRSILEYINRAGKIMTFAESLVHASTARIHSPQAISLEACSPIVVKVQGFEMDEATMKQTLKDGIDIYNQATEDGKTNGTIQILNALALEGNVPLYRWRQDIAQRKINLMTTSLGGLKGEMPTKIPEVYVEYSYANEPRSMPQLAVIVAPLK